MAFLFDNLYSMEAFYGFYNQHRQQHLHILFLYVGEIDRREHWRQTREGWEHKGYSVQREQKSIHSALSIKFCQEELAVSGWHLRVLEQGYMPRFTHEPGQYREDNNRSAIRNMDTVRSTVQEWLAAGYVEKLEEPAWCCNPLTVAEKVVAGSQITKKRVCIDMSRHVNQCLVEQQVNLEDLSAVEALERPGDYACIFDLEN